MCIPPSLAGITQDACLASVARGHDDTINNSSCSVYPESEEDACNPDIPKEINTDNLFGHDSSAVLCFLYIAQTAMLVTTFFQAEILVSRH